MVYRRRPAPFGAEPDPRVRLIKAAEAQMRSPFKALPAAIVERSSRDTDPARRSDPASFSSVAPEAGGGGAGDGGPGGGGGWGEAR